MLPVLTWILPKAPIMTSGTTMIGLANVPPIDPAHSISVHVKRTSPSEQNIICNIICAVLIPMFDKVKVPPVRSP